MFRQATCDDSQSTKNELKNCIERHNELIEVFDTLNGIYGIPLLAQILSASVVIGLIGFVIVVSQNALELVEKYLIKINSGQRISLRHSVDFCFVQLLSSDFSAMLVWKYDKRKCE